MWIPDYYWHILLDFLYLGREKATYHHLSYRPSYLRVQRFVAIHRDEPRLYTVLLPSDYSFFAMYSAVKYILLNRKGLPTRVIYSGQCIMPPGM